MPEAVAAHSGYARLALDAAIKDRAQRTELMQALPSLPRADRDEYSDFLERTKPDEWTERVRQRMKAPGARPRYVRRERSGPEGFRVESCECKREP